MPKNTARTNMPARTARGTGTKEKIFRATGKNSGQSRQMAAGNGGSAHGQHAMNQQMSRNAQMGGRNPQMKTGHPQMGGQHQQKKMGGQHPQGGGGKHPQMGGGGNRPHPSGQQQQDKKKRKNQTRLTLQGRRSEAPFTYVDRNAKESCRNGRAVLTLVLAVEQLFQLFL